MITPCRAAVLGHPIAHSLSPALHRAAYEWAGLNWRYDACDVTEDSLADFVAACGPEWAGLSLTMPLKRAIIPLLDEVSPLAASVDAVNTVVFRDGIALGDNTDIPGMVSAISAVQRSPLSTACILGGGATARSALVAIARLGAREVAVFVRRPEAGESMQALAAWLGVSLTVEPWVRAAEGLLADLVVSTVPAGAADGLVGSVPWEPGVLLDVVYAGWPTALARSWLDHGGPVASGLDLLVEQAALQFTLMTGQPAPLEVMRAAGTLGGMGRLGTDASG